MTYIDDVFGARGHLSRGRSDYRPRNGQLTLARAIDAAMTGGAHLLAQAPTGTGKSFAYLVPAIFHAVHHDKKVVVATANIALQEQLVKNDLPLLASCLPWKFSFEQVKGRKNYLCIDKREQLGAQSELTFSAAEKRDLDELLAWADKTRGGDRAELPFEPAERIWSRLAIVDDDECKGSDCPVYDDCFVTQARNRARHCHVVVTNQHLLMAHASLGPDRVLPKFDIAIVDEAHRLADTAREFHGFRLSELALEMVARSVERQGCKQEAEGVRKASRVFFAGLRRYCESGAYKARLKVREPVDVNPLQRVLDQSKERLRNMIEPNLWPDGDEPGEAIRLLKELPAGERARVAGIRHGISRLSSVQTRLADAMQLRDEGRVYFVETDEKRVMLASKPISVGAELDSGLFSATRCVVATSATLCIAGDFDFASRQLGAGRPRTIEVRSPFQWRKQAMLVTPVDAALPAPNTAGYRDAIGRALAEIIRMARGRTLALFTSADGMRAAAGHLTETGYRVLMQGRDGSRMQLIEEFRKDVSSVLLGLESFWAGVDVPGEALSCVVMDKLPFLPPDDPIVDGINAQSADAFRTYQLPRAIISVLQGFGRLIRTPQDRGCVVLLDPRIHHKRYGGEFMAALPDVARSDRLADVGAFLDGRL